MYSLAFVCDDVEFVVTEALKTIPEQSRFYKCMQLVIDSYHKYPSDWKQAWLAVNNDYNFDIGCPEGVYTAYDIDAVINSAYVIIGLLYGQKNYYRTMDISCRCGCDSDCNPASAAGILGAMTGYEAIPDYWRKPIEEVADRAFKFTEISFNKASDLSFDQALQVIERNGGSVTEDAVTIRTQIPEPVRFEECFTGHWPTGVIFIRKPLDEVDTVRFEGKGIVIRYDFEKTAEYKTNGYVAEVEAYLDGNLVQTLHLPSGGVKTSPEFFYKYNLDMGKHTLNFKWLNKEPGIGIRLSRGIVYSDKANITVHEDK